MVRTTRKQREAIARLWSRIDERPPYRHFRRTASGTFGMDGAVVVQFCGMWVAIERDGHCSGLCRARPRPHVGG